MNHKQPIKTFDVIGMHCFLGTDVLSTLIKQAALLFAHHLSIYGAASDIETTKTLMFLICEGQDL